MKSIFDSLRKKIDSLKGVELYDGIKYVSSNKVHKAIDKTEEEFNYNKSKVRNEVLDNFVVRVKKRVYCGRPPCASRTTWTESEIINMIEELVRKVKRERYGNED